VGLGTRVDLRLAMLRFRLRSGPTAELVWFVAETDALKRVRSDVSAADRARLIAETRRWVMRDLRGGNESARNGSSGKAKNAAGAAPHHPPATWPAWSGASGRWGSRRGAGTVGGGSPWKACWRVASGGAAGL